MEIHGERQARLPFDKMSIGPARMTDDALDRAQDRICDLAPGEWALTGNNSVRFDDKSRLFTVDMYDQVLKIGNRSTLENSAVVGRFMVESGNETLDGYVADMRYVKHVMYRYRHMNLDMGDDIGAVEAVRRKFGAKVLDAVVLREYGSTVHYLGKSEFVQAAAGLCLEVDAFAAQVTPNNTYASVPHVTPPTPNAVKSLPSLPEVDKED